MFGVCGAFSMIYTISDVPIVAGMTTRWVSTYDFVAGNGKPYRGGVTRWGETKSDGFVQESYSTVGEGWYPGGDQAPYYYTGSSSRSFDWLGIGGWTGQYLKTTYSYDGQGGWTSGTADNIFITTYSTYTSTRAELTHQMTTYVIGYVATTTGSAKVISASSTLLVINGVSSTWLNTFRVDSGVTTGATWTTTTARSPVLTTRTVNTVTYGGGWGLFGRQQPYNNLLQKSVIVRDTRFYAQEFILFTEYPYGQATAFSSTAAKMIFPQDKGGDSITTISPVYITRSCFTIKLQDDLDTNTATTLATLTTTTEYTLDRGLGINGRRFVTSLTITTPTVGWERQIPFVTTTQLLQQRITSTVVTTYTNTTHFTHYDCTLRTGITDTATTVEMDAFVKERTYTRDTEVTMAWPTLTLYPDRDRPDENGAARAEGTAEALFTVGFSGRLFFIEWASVAHSSVAHFPGAASPLNSKSVIQNVALPFTVSGPRDSISYAASQSATYGTTGVFSATQNIIMPIMFTSWRTVSGTSTSIVSVNASGVSLTSFSVKTSNIDGIEVSETIEVTTKATYATAPANSSTHLVEAGINYFLPWLFNSCAPNEQDEFAIYRELAQGYYVQTVGAGTHQSTYVSKPTAVRLQSSAIPTAIQTLGNDHVWNVGVPVVIASAGKFTQHAVTHYPRYFDVAAARSIFYVDPQSRVRGAWDAIIGMMYGRPIVTPY